MDGSLWAADAWYKCTVASSVGLLHRASERVFALPHDVQRFRDPEGREPDRPSVTQVFCERAPGLSWTAEILTQASDEQFLLLLLHRVGHWAEALTPLKGLLAEKVWGANGHHGLPRAPYSALVSHGPAATVHVGLRQAPRPLQGEARHYFSSWRQAEKKRLKAELITSDCRHSYIDPSKQKPQDLFFQLGVILSQADKLPASDIDVVHTALVCYLRTNGYDRAVAHDVVHTALRNFAVPEDWHGLLDYLHKTAIGLRKNTFRDDTSPEQRKRFLDPPCTIYSPLGGAQELGKSVRQIYRDIRKVGPMTYERLLGLSKAHVEALREAPGEDTIGQTLLLNPGMLAQGGYVTVTCTPETLTAQRVPGHDTRHYSTSPFLPSSL